MNSEVTGKFISSPEQEDGRSQQESSDGKTRRKFGPARPRANRSVVQEGKKVRTTRGIYGPTFIDSPTPAGPLSLLESRLRERLAAIGSTESPLIWKESVTPAGRSISRLAPSTPRTSDSDSTGSQPQMAYWRTPLVHHDSRRPKGTDLKGNWIKDDQNSDKNSDRSSVSGSTPWDGAEWRPGTDGNLRRAQPDLRLMVDGLPGCMDANRLVGNSIVPFLAAQVLGAILDVRGR